MWRKARVEVEMVEPEDAQHEHFDGHSEYGLCRGVALCRWPQAHTISITVSLVLPICRDRGC
jgi:hypothetical protein